MRRTRKIRWQLKAIALGFAAAAAFSGVASAGQMPLGYAPEIEAELAMIEGSSQSGYVGVARPDGFQPQLSGGEQLVIRGAPDGSQPQLRGPGEASVSAAGVERRSFDVGAGALGFGLGLILTASLAFALAMSRGGIRTAHS